MTIKNTRIYILINIIHTVGVDIRNVEFMILEYNALQRVLKIWRLKEVGKSSSQTFAINSQPSIRVHSYWFLIRGPTVFSDSIGGKRGEGMG